MKIRRVHKQENGSYTVADILQINTLQQSADRQAFFSTLSDQNAYLFHGSKQSDITCLETKRKSREFGTNQFGKRSLVFATPDIYWAMWFALLDRTQIQVTMNACYIGDWGHGIESVYEFGIDAQSYALNTQPLTAGYLYVLPAHLFSEKNHEAAYQHTYLAEYGSPNPVAPLCCFKVIPSDFPYNNAIHGCQYDPEL